MNYQEALNILKSRDRKKLENNTWLEKRDNGLAIKLHETDIILIQENKYILNTGG